MGVHFPRYNELTLQESLETMPSDGINDSVLASNGHYRGYCPVEISQIIRRTSKSETGCCVKLLKRISP